MRRGPRAAGARVDVTVDGSGINKGLVDAFDDSTKDVEKSGEEHGDKYSVKFSDRFRKKLDKMQGEVSKRLEKQLMETGESAGDKAGDRMGRTMIRRLTTRFRTSGGQVGDALGKSILEAVQDVEVSVGTMLDGLENRVNSVSGNARRGGSRLFPPRSPDDQLWLVAHQMDKKIDADRLKAQEKLAQAYIDMLETAHRLNKKFDADRAASQEKTARAQVKMLETAHRMNQKFDADRVKEQEKAIRDQEKADRDRVKMLETAHRLNAKFDADRLKVIANENRLRQKALRDFGNATARMFGKGSRNNALNLLGSTIGGILNVSNRLVKSMSSLGGGGGGAPGLDGIGKAFSGIAASAPAAAAGVLAVVAAMSIMVSVGSALLALLTALTSTLVSGVTAALVVTGGAIAAVAAAAGLLTAAFMSMDDAQKKLLKDSFRPLRAEMVGLGQLMIKDMVPAFGIWSKNLQEALLLAEPVARVMGGAFAEAGKILTSSLSGPGFQRFAQALTVYLPGIVTKLSGALGGFLNGLMGTFAALMPFVDRFAGYLERVANRWSTWANSAQGQNAIVDFTTRAVTSLLSLWNFVREFTGFLVDVLFSPAAQNTGNSMFDSLANSFEGFRRKISDGSLERWFNDAIKFGGDLKEAFKGLSAVIGALYSSGVLTGVGTALRFVGEMFNFVADALRPLIKVIGVAAPYSVWLLIGPLKILMEALKFVGQFAQWAFDKAKLFNNLTGNIPLLGPLGSLVDVLNKVENAAGRAISKLARLANVKTGVTGVGSKISPQSPTLNIGAGASQGASQIGTSLPSSSLQDLISSGNTALGNTSSGSGGGGGGAYQNPYAGLANSILANGRKDAVNIKKVLATVNKLVAAGIAEAAKSADAAAVRNNLSNMAKEIRDAGKAAVAKARSAVQSAASELAGASNPKAANAALARLRKAQSQLAKVLAVQKKLNAQASFVAGQKSIRWDAVTKIVDGVRVQNVTLAEYAAARQRVAKLIDKANEELANAIDMRNDYNASVTQATKDFGSILTTQARTLNGVAQALTAGDIITNLEGRLEKIRKFQENLRLLVAMGISDSAYKQLVDAGVEQGGAFADAIIAGGQGAVSQINDLLSQIDLEAGSLGNAASQTLYQSGINVAQGIVDGLKKWDAQLKAASEKLGAQIAASIKKGLTTDPKKPAKPTGGKAGSLTHEVSVGSGGAVQYGTWTSGPAVTTPRAVATPVSSPRLVIENLTVSTPTSDPHAVAMETINELFARL